MLKILDLFSGIGGFSLGLERTGGFKTVAFCEIDPFCRKVLAKHWPGVPIIPDITTEFPLSPEVFPAKTFLWPADAPALPDNVQDSGGIWWQPFAWYSPSTRSWRTWQRCLEQGWEPYSGTWPTKGMTRNGIAYRPVLSGVRPSDNGSGLLPSPCARDGKDVSSTSAHLASRRRHQPSAATRLLERGLHWSMISEAYGRIMGFPSRWNVAGSGSTETQSSLKSPNALATLSSKRKKKG